jgi:hypothetical protein
MAAATMPHEAGCRRGGRGIGARSSVRESLRHHGHRTPGMPVHDRYATYNWAEEWTMDGQTVPMSFWNRPLHAMTDAFTAAGFRISVISEPHPVPEARELFPDEFAGRQSFLCFLFFVLQAG